MEKQEPEKPARIYEPNERVQVASYDAIRAFNKDHDATEEEQHSYASEVANKWVNIVAEGYDTAVVKDTDGNQIILDKSLIIKKKKEG
jgi:hypothetical protein